MDANDKVISALKLIETPMLFTLAWQLEHSESRLLRALGKACRQEIGFRKEWNPAPVFRLPDLSFTELIANAGGALNVAKGFRNGDPRVMWLFTSVAEMCAQAAQETQTAGQLGGASLN